jgi:methylglutaconyl-CoA hydratase
MTKFSSLQRLRVTLEGRIATITLARPERRNAFDEVMIEELTTCFSALEGRSDVRVIVLRADGPVFCAGADLHWMKRMAGYSDAENHADAMALARMLNVIYTCRAPVVAGIQGDCYGGGVGLVAACDVAISVDTAHYCLSEARIGLIPATIAPYIIRAMGERAARRYCLSAERFRAYEALRIGLIHEVVMEDALSSAVDGLARTIADNGPHAVHECKRLIADLSGQPIDDSLIEETAQRIARIRASEEGREGVRCFLEKLPMPWR